MGQTFLPSFALAATSRYMAMTVYDKDFNMLDGVGLPIPTDIILVNPYILKDQKEWWPRKEQMFDFQDTSTGMSMMLGPVGWSSTIYEVTGRAGWTYRIVGICYNSFGQVVSNARCRLFRTVDDAQIAETYSAQNGEYGFGVPDNTTQYYVQGMRNAPAIGGISARTLTGSA